MFCSVFQRIKDLYIYIRTGHGQLKNWVYYVAYWEEQANFGAYDNGNSMQPWKAETLIIN